MQETDDSNIPNVNTLREDNHNLGAKNLSYSNMNFGGETNSLSTVA